MELELYAKVPDGYELVGLRRWLAKEDFVDIDGVVENVDFPGCVDEIRMIVRKIKPRIKRSFRVDVLDEPDRLIRDGEAGAWINREGDFCLRKQNGYFDGTYIPCIVTELEVPDE